ncbi:MAG: FlgD immunoglobulin-like domain containing protein [Candidatus Latescibacterota bacterium]
MKRFFLPILLIFAVTSAYGAPFQPTKLVLSAPSTIQYNFDGSTLHIPLTVNGKSSYTIFAIYTRDQGTGIGTFQNGLLGWHYVSKMDTCVFLRADGVHETGSGEIAWDGKDSYGTKVPKGSYTYYLWGFDNQSPKIPASTLLTMGHEEAQPLHIEDTDESGNKLANPYIYCCTQMNYAASSTVPLTTYKWRVGVAPETALSDIEWTTSGRGDINRTGGSIALDPADHSMMYVGEMDPNYATYITKYKWVPGGAAVLQTAWGDNGTYQWTSEEVRGWLPMTGVVGDGADLLFMSYMNQIDSNPFSQILVLDRETGSKVKTVDLSKWYCSKIDADGGGQMNSGPTDIDFSNGVVTSQGNYWCTTVAIDPYREVGAEVAWVNRNGDYVHDKNFLPDAANKWMCNQFGPPPWTYTWKTDTMGFSIFPVNNLGTANFGLIGPSGQGIGYFGTASGTGYGGLLPMKVGSAYDGLYLDNGDITGHTEVPIVGIWYVGYDTIKGVITDQPTGVADAAPAAFSVAQNTPNPFNPSTTISFNLAKAGKVTVDVFNISGQKVGTLVNTTMNAGSHSVTWNASNRSAGVYFYTVKSDNYSKTMKMTLLK